MNRLSLFFREHARYVYAFLTLIIGLYLCVSMVAPDFYTYKKRSKSVRLFEFALIEQQRQVLDADALEKEWVRLRRLIMEKERAFFTEKEALYFKDTVFPQLAESADVHINSRSYLDKRSLENGGVLYPIHVSVTASYEELMTVIASIESYEKIVKVLDLSISRLSVDPVQLSVQMTIGAYGL